MILNKDSRIEKLEKTVDELNLQLDDYEQYSRRNTLRINGVPDEEEEQLVDKMVYLFNTRMNVSPPITPEHIDRTHRIGRFDRTNTRTILVKFATNQARDRVFRARKKLKKKRNGRGDGGAETLPVETDDKVHDSDHESENSANEEDELQEFVQPMPIRPTFGAAPIKNASINVTEDLTKLRATLFWKARKLVTERKLSACWTWDGRILVQTHNGKIEAITREHDLKH